MKNRIVAALMTVAFMFGFLACTDDRGGSQGKERKVALEQLDQFLRNQPVPVFSWSQLRQNLIELMTAQANTTATTSFFFNQGVPDPIFSCPSVGFPIPATFQLTNPQTKYPDHSLIVSQLEATGVYTGDTSGTYALCVGADGEAFAFYWEGFVQTVTGVAEWDPGTHQIRMLSGSTFDFTEGQGK